MKKILFCFFSQNTLKHYTPLDIGYIISRLDSSFLENVEILGLSYGHSDPVKSNTYIGRDIELIKYHTPCAVFFFLDNVLWSGVYALGRAEKLAKKIRDKFPDVFLGMQSYKFQAEEIDRLLRGGIIDVVIEKNPIESFENLGKILQKKEVDGVTYFDESENKLRKYEKTGIEEKNLDNLFSPYLLGILDNYVAKKQLDYRGQFSCFLYSAFGCPFRCYYCFRSVKYAQPHFFSVKRFFDEIEYLLDNFSVKNFFILDDSFLVDKIRQPEFFSEFEKRKKCNQELNNIRLSAMIRPELLDRQSVDFLKSINIDWVQIGLQTINPNLGKYIGRDSSFKNFNAIAKWFHEKNIKLHIDVIIGLPDDTLDYFKKTIEYALKLKPYAMQVKQFYLNPNTLFFNKREKYEIVLDENKRDFAVPFVAKARGIDEKYIKEATNFTIEKIKENPKIKWKLLTMYRHFVSDFHKKI